jgi:23S rRNA (uracil1939-C5)-methyltransferase
MARRKKLPTEPFDTEITALLPNGRGACRHGDANLEIHGALPGERVRARYLFGRRFRGQAEALEVLESSPDRAEPFCPHFDTCSACTLQHMGLPAQLAFKQQVLLGHLDTAGVPAPETLAPPLQADTRYYRRKARLSVRHVKGKGRVLVGFRERDGRFVADINECHILPAMVADRLPDLAKLVGMLESFDTIPQIEVTCGDDRCALIFRHLEPLPESDLDKLREFAGTSGLAVLLQPKGPDTVTALEPADPGLAYALPEYGLDYRFEPLDFVQVNGSLNRAMIGQALAWLQPGPEDRVLDLFCGLGNFTLPLARHCGSVTGIEGDAGLVERARENAARNGVRNAIFEQSDLYSGGQQSWVGAQFDRVLLDPPRSGAEQILPLIAATGTSKILYVSCNPATLARDIGILVTEHGFRLQAAGAMDMFPHTPHVESMALLGRD